MDKKYSFANDSLIYERWLEANAFLPAQKGKGFTVVIPPPNITGILHIGHAYDNTLQDAVIRFQRMQGKAALYFPGTDHAGVATQAKVDAKLKEQGTNRFEIGRTEFLKAAWDWKTEHEDTIRRQWQKMGLSLDYSRELFTLDKGHSEIVAKRFIELYERGLIYRDYKIINWDIQAKTALSNIEVVHKEGKSKLYFIKYLFKGSETDGVVVATTRPETCFADQALMVNPKDERYRALIGKTVLIPTTNIEIPIIADEYVEKDFGTGVVKVTPAHDPNDFEVAKRHNLAKPLCMHEDGTLNEMAGKYQGQDRFVCRENLLVDLSKTGQFIKAEEHLNSVGYSERTDTVVEPRLSLQWFLKMDYFSKLARSSKTKFYPARFKKIFINWMTDTLDWCISRQVWWGHRIPVWYKGTEIKAQIESPGEGWCQDEDVLDTWFSSSLWPLSCLSQKPGDFERFFPTQLLVTGYDIIFFWVSRMIFQSLDIAKTDPFKEVLIHGLVRAADGQKMSKSLNNGINPFDVIKEFGADSLRYFLVTSSSPGTDIRYDRVKIESAWNNLNKLWNISRFILSDYTKPVKAVFAKTLADNYILSSLNETILKYTRLFKKYEFQEAAKVLQNFIWQDFSSEYLEIAKVQKKADELKDNTNKILVYVLSQILKLLHPIVPFVTENIFSMYNSELIISARWPKAKKEDNKAVFTDFEIFKKVLLMLRSYIAENKITKALSVTLVAKNAKTKAILFENLENIRSILKLAELNLVDACQVESAELIDANFSVFVHAEKQNPEQLKEQLKHLEAEIKRSESILNNSGFLAKAPTAKIDAEKEKYEKYLKEFEKVKNALQR